jgi:hypothetical protein
MLKLETIQKKANTLELDTRIEKLTSGKNGLFIKLEKVIDGKARMISREIEGVLIKYSLIVR